MKPRASQLLIYLCTVLLVALLSLQANADGPAAPAAVEDFVAADTSGTADSEETPSSFALHQNYPNPFNPSTLIRYEVASRSHVRLVVYDMLGKEVRTLVSQEHTPGTYRVHFDAGQLTSGVYILSMKSDNGFHAVRRMVLTQ